MSSNGISEKNEEEKEEVDLFGDFFKQFIAAFYLWSMSKIYYMLILELFIALSFGLALFEIFFLTDDINGLMFDNEIISDLKVNDPCNQDHHVKAIIQFI